MLGGVEHTGDGLVEFMIAQVDEWDNNLAVKERLVDPFGSDPLRKYRARAIFYGCE